MVRSRTTGCVRSIAAENPHAIGEPVVTAGRRAAACMSGAGRFAEHAQVAYAAAREGGPKRDPRTRRGSAARASHSRATSHLRVTSAASRQPVRERDARTFGAHRGQTCLGTLPVRVKIDTHRLVAAIGGGIEHARAAAVDHRDALLAAVVGRRLGDAPGAGSAVHPDMLDGEVGALAHRCFGGLGSGSDHDRIDAAGDRAQVAVAAIAFDLVGVRIDGEDVIAPSRRRWYTVLLAWLPASRETPVTATRL